MSTAQVFMAHQYMAMAVLPEGTITTLEVCLFN